MNVGSESTEKIEEKVIVETIEQDTNEDESIPDLYTYLLPSLDVRNDQRSFGLYFDKNVFEGWCKQPSACCAAASVAGAWNCLANLTRNERHLGALSHEDVLDVYREIFLEIIQKKIASFERLMGAPFMPLFVLIEEELSIVGKVIGGKKVDGANKSIVIKAVRKIAKRYQRRKQTVKSLEIPDGPPNPSNPSDEIASQIPRELMSCDPMDLLVELFHIDGDLLLDSPEEETATEIDLVVTRKKWEEMVEESSSDEDDSLVNYF